MFDVLALRKRISVEFGHGPDRTKCANSMQWVSRPTKSLLVLAWLHGLHAAGGTALNPRLTGPPLRSLRSFCTERTHSSPSFEQRALLGHPVPAFINFRKLWCLASTRALSWFERHGDFLRLLALEDSPLCAWCTPTWGFPRALILTNFHQQQRSPTCTLVNNRSGLASILARASRGGAYGQHFNYAAAANRLAK